MYLLQVNQNKNCYHLNINVKHIVNIFYPDLEETTGAIKKLEVQNFGASAITKLIDQFENSYTNFEYKPPSAHDSTLNRTNGSKKFHTSSKSAPYQIPAHLTKSNGNQLQRNQQANSTVKTITNGVLSVSKTNQNSQTSKNSSVIICI